MDNKQYYQNKKEAYLLANRDPWLLWRAQALRAGYIPPLVNGQIPPEMSGLHFGAKEEYNIEPLKMQAKRMKVQEKGLIPKLFVILLIGGMLMGGFCYYLYTSTDTRFKVNLINALIPRNESKVELWYQ